MNFIFVLEILIRMGSGQRSIFKITLLGDGTVGKTSLRKTFLGEGFREGYSMTIGADFAVKHIQMADHHFVAQIWDLAGQQRFSSVREIYYRGTSGCLLVFDITRRSSFENIPSWIYELLKNNFNKVVPLIIIGNKSDLRDSAKDPVMSSEAVQYAKTLTEWSGFKVPYVETSAKTGEHVEEAFLELLQNIMSFFGESCLGNTSSNSGDD